jgi:hypothetical protein
MRNTLESRGGLRRAWQSTKDNSLGEVLLILLNTGVLPAKFLLTPNGSVPLADFVSKSPGSGLPKRLLSALPTLNPCSNLQPRG